MGSCSCGSGLVVDTRPVALFPPAQVILTSAGSGVRVELLPWMPLSEQAPLQGVSLLMDADEMQSERPKCSAIREQPGL